MKRCYKPAFTIEASVKIILEGRGKHFDPKVVDIFSANLPEFIAIQKDYSD
jgi:putative two-component system response regulator